MSLSTPTREALEQQLQEAVRIAPGYGLKRVPRHEMLQRLAEEDHTGLHDVLQVYQPPRKGQLYVIGVDVSNGQGLDASVIDVTRVGTIKEPDEQVAQFYTDSIEATDLAYIIGPIGELYSGRDGLPALVAIECNGFGLGTQSELLRHVGYTNLFIWQHEDALTPEGRFTKRYGWWTSPRTRPLILQRYFHAVKTVDPVTGYPDYRINSPLTIRELATFVSPGPLWMAEAAEGCHDDCIMAGAISVHIAHTIHADSREPIAEARRRVAEEAARASEVFQRERRQITHQTTDVTVDELHGWADDGYINGVPDVAHYL
jgi:hypothetical protein